ncbi:hypothetical protein [Meiothermus sp. CFH 77666]|nr:hypothetical protein [Meiothermus sp. CFH 77666]MBO1435952.1 hypothetical protein [Meiothermus sp. CFH 77666]
MKFVFGLLEPGHYLFGHPLQGLLFDHSQVFTVGLQGLLQCSGLGFL